MRVFEEIIRTVEENRALVMDTLICLWEHPETGYRDFKGSAYLEKAFSLPLR